MDESAGIEAEYHHKNNRVSFASQLSNPPSYEFLGGYNLSVFLVISTFHYQERGL